VLATGSITAMALAMPMLPVSRYATPNATLKWTPAKVAVFVRLMDSGTRMVDSRKAWTAH
jgi:hypothetical protein